MSSNKQETSHHLLIFSPHEWSEFICLLTTSFKKVHNNLITPAQVQMFSVPSLGGFFRGVSSENRIHTLYADRHVLLAFRDGLKSPRG